jgi:hypothetical protein
MAVPVFALARLETAPCDDEWGLAVPMVLVVMLVVALLLSAPSRPLPSLLLPGSFRC